MEVEQGEHGQQQTPPTQRVIIASGELEPVQQHERLTVIDALRGFAIFGIFTVNITFFAEPLLEGLNHGNLAEAAAHELWAWMAMRVFSEYKFVSLFSLLFGIGLVIQMNRAKQRGANFAPVFMRRLLVLAGFGIIHGLLVWYGDVLLMYAAAGFILLAMREMSPRALLFSAIGFFLAGWFILSTCVAAGMLKSASQSAGSSSPEAVTEKSGDAGLAAIDSGAGAESVDDRWDRWWEAIASSNFNVEGPEFARAETIAYKEGPFLAAFIMRSLTYAMGVVFSFVLGGFGLRILAMFLLGAALMKWNFFDASRRVWHVRLFAAGFAIGLPLEALMAAAYWSSGFDMNWMTLGSESLHYLGSAALFLGYVGGMTLLASSHAAGFITKALAAVGRMALTNYLAQSVIATFIMYWWGLGLFGEFDRAQQLLLVVCIFLGQIALSVVWLRYFRFGPMEWLWRSLTYGKLQSFR